MIVTGRRWRGGWWFRFLRGWGLAWANENVDDYRGFSVREGFTPALFVSSNRGLRWRFELLRPGGREA